VSSSLSGTPRGGRPAGRPLALPMANAGLLPRVLVSLAIVNGLKLLFRYLIVATAPMGALLPFFAGYNAVATAPFALWAMSAPPHPTTDGGALRRAALTTLALQLGLGLPDTLLHARELMARTPDTMQVTLQLVIQAAPHVMIGLVELLIVWAFGYALLKLRMPKAPRPRATRPPGPRPAATARRP
jgi:hypothetical protein